MSCAIQTGTLVGVDAAPVLVEVDLQRRLPCVTIVGLPSGAVRESADRVRSAMQQAGLEFPRKRVVVNLAPADLPKRGTGFDLPIAVGILAASEQVPAEPLADVWFYGELGLSGELRPVRGALSVVLMARDRGARRVVVPMDCAGEAAQVPGITVLAARHLDEVVAWCRGKGVLPEAEEGPTPRRRSTVDLREVRGQLRARRALEVAAAGGHNLLMVGSPGCGQVVPPSAPVRGGARQLPHASPASRSSAPWWETCPRCMGPAVFREVEPGRVLGACAGGGKARCWWAST